MDAGQAGELVSDEGVDDGVAGAFGEFVALLFSFDQLVEGLEEERVLDGGLEELLEGDGWGGAMGFEVDAGEDGADDVEVFFGPDGFALEVIAEVAFGHVEVVVVATFGGEVGGDEVSPGGEEVGAFEVDDGGVEPFDEGGVGLLEEAEGFGEVPAGEVEVSGEHLFDDVSVGVDGEVAVGGVGVDEADVPVGVLAGEAPGSGAGFDGEEDGDVVILLDLVEGGEDKGVMNLGHDWR